MKFTPGCNCCATACNHQTARIWDCNSAGFPGAFVELRRASDNAVISSDTADASGDVSLPYYVNGTYFLQWSAPSGGNYGVGTSSTFAVTCGTTPAKRFFNAMPAASGFHYNCCTTGGCQVPIPDTLYLDDGIGEVTLTYSGGTWFGCGIRPASKYRNGACTTNFNVTHDVAVGFRFSCLGADYYLTMGPPVCGTDTDYPQDSTCASSLSNLGSGTTNGPPGACDPFTWSGTVSFALGSAARAIYGASVGVSVYA